MENTRAKYLKCKKKKKKKLESNLSSYLEHPSEAKMTQLIFFHCSGQNYSFFCLKTLAEEFCFSCLVTPISPPGLALPCVPEGGTWVPTVVPTCCQAATVHLTAGGAGLQSRSHPNCSGGKAEPLHYPTYFGLVMLTNFTSDTNTYPENESKPMDVTGELATKMQQNSKEPLFWVANLHSTPAIAIPTADCHVDGHCGTSPI